jgi:hypothetical protein
VEGDETPAHAVSGVGVVEIRLDHLEIAVERPEMLEVRSRSSGEIVDDADSSSATKQRFGDVAADESRSTCHEIDHGRFLRACWCAIAFALSTRYLEPRRASWETAGEGGLRMRLEGSCQCGKIRFRVESETPVPFMYCYCSICRKTTGGAFGCTVMGKRDTLRVTGTSICALPA